MAQNSLKNTDLDLYTYLFNQRKMPKMGEYQVADHRVASAVYVTLLQNLNIETQNERNFISSVL